MPTSSRNILLDVLKVFASLFVVAFHCGFLYDYSVFLNYITFSGIFRFILPFFICVNGFFLYSIFKKERVKFWVKRIGILYVVWMLIFAYFWIPQNYHSPLKLLATLFFGFNHLWYLVSFLKAGIVLYFIRNFSNKALIINAAILFFIGYCIQALGDFNIVKDPLLLKLVTYTPSHRNFLFYDLPFLSLGYVIKRSELHLRITKKQVIQLLALSFVLLSIESILDYYYITKPSISLLCLSTFLASPVVFLSAFVFKLNASVDSKLLSLYSIAIYLIHPLIIIVISHFVILKATPLTLITIVLSFIASYILIQLNKTLKYIL